MKSCFYILIKIFYDLNNLFRMCGVKLGLQCVLSEVLLDLHYAIKMPMFMRLIIRQDVYEWFVVRISV